MAEPAGAPLDSNTSKVSDDKGAAMNDNQTTKPAATCCEPTDKATCCAPSEKSACCGDEPATGRCGCR